MALKAINLKLKEVNENIKTVVPAGEFSCFKVTPSNLDGELFKNKSIITILFSDDENRFPCYFFAKNRCVGDDLGMIF